MAYKLQLQTITKQINHSFGGYLYLLQKQSIQILTFMEKYIDKPHIILASTLR